MLNTSAGILHLEFSRIILLILNVPATCIFTPCSWFPSTKHPLCPFPYMSAPHLSSKAQINYWLVIHCIRCCFKCIQYSSLKTTV